MKNQNNTTASFLGSVILLLLVVTSILLLFGATSTKAQEVEDEREFDYAEGSKKGPKRWGKLKKEWAACSNGAFQSPIDMSNERVRLISKPERPIYKPTNATIKNRGHDISLQWGGDAGAIAINGTVYPLRQAHWHSPSEHTIRGRRYDLELHMVHLSTDPNLKNKIAVIGVLYKIGKPDKFLSKLTSYISTMIDEKDEQRSLDVVDPRQIEMHSKRYYRYMGSLTVPPCTEGVIWTINRKVRTVSRDQVMLLREAVHDYAERNARPIQQQNGRDIYLYGPAAS
ncbi:carbonic anhydrase Nec1-like [Coffea arabica]|uniref:Carbonic anhydrase n=1 Tax=Coffea arabica TaxID=13443 RepID=A0ABM4UM02_COFAR|nr:alpha carbonic anhydrase 7-like [Coffea arabica]